MSKENEIIVYAGWEDDRRIGTIYRSQLNGSEVVAFEYDGPWLEKHPDLLLDPSIAQVRYRTYPGDRMLFGAFEDCCPDRWGRMLIDRRESFRAAESARHPRQFFETDYLLGVQDNCRQGGFRFKTDPDGPFLDDDPMPTPPIAAIRELEQISMGYERGDDNRWVKQLVNPGSSLGGARPKANVIDTSGELWIAKFPSRNDTYDVGAWEKTVHDLAGACGIRVPESRLCHYSSLGSTFLVRRFDRDYEGGRMQRIHYASAMTMLQVRDGHTEGTGFPDLAQITGQLSTGADRELEQLYRRMIFDIAVSNQDDHLRNHGFLLKKDHWSLSPAFDMNPMINADFLSMNIDEDDGYRSFDKALETSDYYHLNHDAAAGIIREIAGIVANNWRKKATGYGISAGEQRYMAPAFELAEQEDRKF